MLVGCCLISISACSEEEPEPPLSTFSFRINNGDLIEWNDPRSYNTVCLICHPRVYQSPTHFTLSASSIKYMEGNLIFNFNFPEVTVATFTESIGPGPEIDPFLATHVLYMDPIRGASTEEGDYATVTFTRIQPGNYCDGTFRARLTALPYGPDAEKLELEGEFRNVALYK